MLKLGITSKESFLDSVEFICAEVFGSPEAAITGFCNTVVMKLDVVTLKSFVGSSGSSMSIVDRLEELRGFYA